MITLLSLFIPLVFKGGDLGDLGRCLADWGGQPTIALVQHSARIKPFEIGLGEPGDGKDLVRLLRVKAHLESKAKEDAIGIWDAAWNESTVENTGLDIPTPPGLKGVRPRKEWLKNGRLTIRLKPGEAVRVGDLRALDWSKPFAPHWFVARLWIVPTAQGASEQAFLRSLAAVTAGVLVDSPKAYRVDFSPSAFRPRALATLAQRRFEADTPELASVTGRLVFAAWNAVQDDVLERLYSEPGRREVVRITGAPIFAMADQYLRAMDEFTKSSPADIRSVATAYRGALSRIDMERPLRCALGQRIAASFLWPRKGGGSILL